MGRKIYATTDCSHLKDILPSFHVSWLLGFRNKEQECSGVYALGFTIFAFLLNETRKKTDIQINNRSYKVRANAGIASKRVTESVYILTYVL